MKLKEKRLETFLARFSEQAQTRKVVMQGHNTLA